MKHLEVKFFLKALLIALGVYLSGLPSSWAAETIPALPRSCERIVSVAPSVTETLFFLGLGKQVQGVTRYCSYPKEVKNLPQVGGFLDLNFEAIVRLRPSLVIGLREQRESLQAFEEYGVGTITVDHQKVGGILNSLGELGKTCGIEATAAKLRLGLEEQVDLIRKRAADRGRQRVLLAVGRTSARGLGTVFVSGRDGYYNELLQMVRAENVYEGPTTGVLALSPEAFVYFAPDVIIEIAPRMDQYNWQEEELRKSWQELPLLANLPKLKIAFVKANYAEVPGPRFTALLAEFERALNGR